MPKVAGRQLSERVDDPVTLDPDIALWPVVPLSIWPFAGAPTEGRWPKNWLGIDENSALWVCTEGGTPGTWAQVGSGGGGGWPASNGTGPGNLTAQTAEDDTVGYQMTDQGSGGIGLSSAAFVAIQAERGDGKSATLQLGQTESGRAAEILSLGGIKLLDNTGGAGGGIILSENVDGGITLETAESDTGGVSLIDTGSGGVLLQESGTESGVLIETTGSGDTAGVTIATGDNDIVGIVLNTQGDGLGTAPINIKSGTGEIEILTGAGSLVLEALGGVASLLGGGSTGQIYLGGTPPVEITSSTDMTLTVGGSPHNLLVVNLPTADPHVAHAVWNNAGVLTLSAG